MIIQSAIMINREKYYTGKRHGDCFDKMKQVGYKFKIDDNLVEGFITDELKFLNREDAYYHAYENGQCEMKTLDGKVYCEGLTPSNVLILASEDLW